LLAVFPNPIIAYCPFFSIFHKGYATSVKHSMSFG
jgi:hypothetical protein